MLKLLCTLCYIAAMEPVRDIFWWRTNFKLVSCTSKLLKRVKNRILLLSEYIEMCEYQTSAQTNWEETVRNGGWREKPDRE